jgi:hypothetical protein
MGKIGHANRNNHGPRSNHLAVIKPQGKIIGQSLQSGHNSIFQTRNEPLLKIEAICHERFERHWEADPLVWKIVLCTETLESGTPAWLVQS